MKNNASMHIKTHKDNFLYVSIWAREVRTKNVRSSDQRRNTNNSFQATCGAMLMSGQAALLAILILSDREEVAAWAQQLPQY